jgi:predicted PurR-regulated permease PerM
MFAIKTPKIFDRFDNKERATNITATNKTIFRFWGLFFTMLLLFLTILKSIQMAGQALVWIFTAFFLALALNAPVHWIAQHLPGKRRGSRSLATTLSVVVVIAALVGFLASIVPPFVGQIGGLADTAPTFISDLRKPDSTTGKLIERYNLQDQVDGFSKDLGNKLKDAGGAAVSIVSSIGSSAFAMLTILVLTFMMLTEGPHWIEVGERLIPKRHRAHTRELSRAMYKVVKGYVNGQVTLAAIAAVLIVPMLFILGISYPIALMVVVFICGLIPMVGHTIGAVIVTAVALFTSPIAAVIILIYYITYQQIENYLIQPKIQSNSTNMSPLLVFIAVVLGASLGGLLGGLVAIPIMGCARIIVIDQLTRRNILDSKAARETLAEAEAK